MAREQQRDCALGFGIVIGLIESARRQATLALSLLDVLFISVGTEILFGSRRRTRAV